MRVLMTTQPGLGHLNPMVPIAEALQQAGHEVAFACAASFCPTVEAKGFQALPAGTDWLESKASDFFPELQDLTLEEQLDWFVSDLFADVLALKMAADLLDLCGRWQPDVIVRNDFEFGACVAAERLGLPYATVGIDLLLPSQVWETLIGPQMAYLRSIYGLQPYPALDMLFAGLYISIMPPRYQFPESLESLVSTSLRPVSSDRLDGYGLPAWVKHLPNQSTIYTSMGSVFNQLPDVFQMILAGLDGEPVDLIITVGRYQDPASLGPVPENVHIERYIPQSLLFPYCDLVITHGGPGTTLGALTHGIPVLVIPMSSTQPLHALRCMALGIGKALRYKGQFGEFLSDEVSTLTSQTVRSTVRELLGNPSYRQAAERMRTEIETLPGTEQAVASLVELVRSHPTTRTA